MGTKQKTYGQELINLSFNPSKDSKVDRLKELAAEMVDIVNDDDVRGNENLHANLKTWSINQILQAQMAAVKAVTYELTKGETK
jgi:transcription termination factor NusB